MNSDYILEFNFRYCFEQIHKQGHTIKPNLWLWFKFWASNFQLCIWSGSQWSCYNFLKWRSSPSLFCIFWKYKSCSFCQYHIFLPTNIRKWFNWRPKSGPLTQKAHQSNWLCVPFNRMILCIIWKFDLNFQIFRLTLKIIMYFFYFSQHFNLKSKVTRWFQWYIGCKKVKRDQICLFYGKWKILG